MKKIKLMKIKKMKIKKRIKNKNKNKKDIIIMKNILNKFKYFLYI